MYIKQIEYNLTISYLAPESSEYAFCVSIRTNAPFTL